MAVKYLSQILATAGIDLQQKQLSNARIQNLAVAPASPVAGQIYYDTASSTMYFYNGSAWVDMSGDIQSVIAGAGLTGGGSSGAVTLNVGAGTGIQVNADSIELDHLGLESLTDPNADRIFFWDDSASSSAWLTVDSATGVRINGTTLDLNLIPNSSLANNSIQIIAGNGLTGGGSPQLGGNTTLNVAATANSGITVVADAIQLTNYASLVADTVLKWDGTQLKNTTITDDGTTVTIGGNLTVSGTITYVNSNTVEIGDNIILLNRDETGVPSQNAGFEVERGTSANVSFIWNEASDYFSTVDQAFHIGSIADLTISDSSTVLFSDGGVVKKQVASDLIDLLIVSAETGAASPASGTLSILAGEGINTSGTGSAITISGEDASETNKGIVELATSAETVTGTSTTLATHPAGVKAAIDSALAATGFAASVGDATNTVYAVTHNLGTRDVVVQVYDNATYETVFVDTVRTSTNVVTLTFAVAPTLNAYRVVIQKIL